MVPQEQSSQELMYLFFRFYNLHKTLIETSIRTVNLIKYYVHFLTTMLTANFIDYFICCQYPSAYPKVSPITYEIQIFYMHYNWNWNTSRLLLFREFLRFSSSNAKHRDDFDMLCVYYILLF